MGDSDALYSVVRARPKGPGHADDHQLLGDINGEGATLLGHEFKCGFETNLPRVLARLAQHRAQPHLPPLGGVA
jgi:hypothetical protein